VVNDLRARAATTAAAALVVAALCFGCTSINTTCGTGEGGTSGPGQGGIGGTIPAGEQWVAATTNLAGLPSECGNMSFLSARADRDMLIAGIAQQGLWALAAGATDWIQLGKAAGSGKITNRTSSIVYDPDHLDTFWESGIYNDPGVFRTDDNGVTVTALGNSAHNDSVSVDFTDPARNTLLAGGHEQPNRLIKSTDGGKTWIDIGAMLPPTAGNSTEAYVLDAQTFLLGTYAAMGSGVYRSTDGGMTWIRAYDHAIWSHPLLAHDAALYWLLGNNEGVIKSTDRGVSWTNVGGANVVVTNRGGAGLLELPDGRLVSLGGGTLVLSSDQGATWRGLGPQLPYSPSGVVYSRFRKAFYIWHFSCGNNPPVPADAIMMVSFDYETAK
jgi:hypothetical protein